MVCRPHMAQLSNQGSTFQFTQRGALDQSGFSESFPSKPRPVEKRGGSAQTPPYSPNPPQAEVCSRNYPSRQENRANSTGTLYFTLSRKLGFLF